MIRSAAALTTVLALCGALATAGDAPKPDYPKLVRVTVQFISVPHPLLTELMAAPDTRGHIIHAHLMERVKKGDARIIDTAMVTGKSSNRCTVESISEFIYPTEYDGGDMPNSVVSNLPTPPELSTPYPVNPRTRVPPCWDTRNTGFTLEIEPCIGEDGLIDLRFVPESVTLVRFDTWQKFRDQWGDASVRMPVFETLRANASVTLVSGRFDLVSVLTPKPTSSDSAHRDKALVFVRADILTVSPPAAVEEVPAS